jgi:lysophospholipase L1-like esterase
MYDFNKVRVFHRMDSTQYQIHWDHPEDVQKTVLYPAMDMTEFQLAHYRDTLDLHFVKTDSLQQGFTLYGFSLETSDPGFVYHSMGVNGASVPSWLRSDHLGAEMQAFLPDVVVFSIGINDAYTTDFSPAAYERNYDSLITRIRNVSPATVFLFTTNTDCYYKRKYPNKNGEKVRDTMMRLAKKYNGAVWDTFGVMGGLGSVKKWQAAGLGQADRVHFTPDGYRLLGDLLSEAIASAYAQHVERRYAGR